MKTIIDDPELITGIAAADVTIASAKASKVVQLAVSCAVIALAEAEARPSKLSDESVQAVRQRRGQGGRRNDA